MTDRIEGLEGYAKAPVGAPEVRILRLEPGDVLVLNVEKRLSIPEYDEVMERLRGSLPQGASHPCLVLDGGITLDILRRERNEAGEKQ